jgi:uncharacterized membrane protein
MSRSSALCACIAALVLCACSKQQVPSSPPAGEDVPTPTATAPATAAPAAEPPAESSLALKRGMLSLATEQVTFQPCGEDAPLWVIDQTDGVLHETFAKESKPLELYVEAHGERTPVPTSSAAARPYRGAFILEEVLYATPPSEANGCKEPAPTYVVAARGNEPFWAAEVTEDKLTWRQPDAPQELVIDAVQSEDAEGAVGYTGSAQGHTIEVFIEAQACRDSMSGAYFAYSARASFDGKALKGCARIGD